MKGSFSGGAKRTEFSACAEYSGDGKQQGGEQQQDVATIQLSSDSQGKVKRE